MSAYFTSCSRLWNISERKKSSIVIPNPSHSFWIVETVVLLFLPPIMLLRVDCVTPLIVASLLTVIFRSLHNSTIRSFTAFPIVISIPPNANELCIYCTKKQSKSLPQKR